MKNLDVKFNINFHFALENYFRIFIPHIFKDYTKVLYLDCDAVLCTDVANIYNLSLDDKMIGAVKDFIVINEVISKNDYQYYYNQLKLKQPMDYINSGVLLLDIKKLLDFDFTNKCIDLIRDFVPKFVDQCIINKVADGNIKFLDAKYNSSSALDELLAVNNKKMNLPNELYEQYKKSLINPYFVHFMSNLKPWNSLWIKNSDLFWSIARQTEVYEKILYKNIYNYKAVEKDILIDIVKFNKNKFLYYCYVILSKIIFGKKRKVYKQNKNELKAKLKQVKFFLR